MENLGVGGELLLKDNLANRSHMFSFVFLWPFSGFKILLPWGICTKQNLLRCLGINLPLLFIPHLSHNPPFVTSQLATCGDDYNVMNKGL